MRTSLLCNGLDFLSMALLNRARAGTESRFLKYAVRDLWAGLELLFKARLAQHHWSLIVTNPKKPISLAQYRAGKFKSVSYKEMIDPLKSFCGIHFSPEMLKAFEDLRQLRNKIEHFEFEILAEEIDDLFIKVMCGLLDFLKNYTANRGFTAQERTFFDEMQDELMHWPGFSEVRGDFIGDLMDLDHHRFDFCISCEERVSVRNLRKECVSHRISELEIAYYEDGRAVFREPWTCLEYTMRLCKICGVLNYIHTEDLEKATDSCNQCGSLSMDIRNACAD